MQSFSRPRLLVVELWGLGDLTLAAPFLQEASRHAQVTLVAKPQWASLLGRFCPEVELIPFDAPWTAFIGKYRLASWPWREIRKLMRTVRAQQFEVSARPDPRDHLLLLLAGANRRLGFPRVGSGLLLQTRLAAGGSLHRAEAWRRLARALGWDLPAPDGQRLRPVAPGAPIVLHSGAARPTRVWPLERFADLATRVRRGGHVVRVLCDASQVPGWRRLGETDAVAPLDVGGLVDAMAAAACFIGNDSGPGHVAALCGVPTFTIFGPQLPGLFAPTHPQAAWIDGRPCPYKPCFDSCRFAEPHCIRKLPVDDVRVRLESWLSTGCSARSLGPQDPMR
jgi:ADP-heptose:LPS heptosyltransferase